MNIIFSTRNPSKVRQVARFFDGSGIFPLSLDDLKIPGEAVEDGETLLENASKKALHAHRYLNSAMWVMAEDTGLYINALNGEPGIRAARWAGDNATTEDITLFTLRKLKGKADRSATFETVVVVISPSGAAQSFAGRINGRILESQRVSPQPNMPYSGIFVPEGSDKVWAEMPIDYENSISHRGQAFKKVRAFLEMRIDEEENGR